MNTLQHIYKQVLCLFLIGIAGVILLHAGTGAAHAQTCQPQSGCTRVGDCVNSKLCRQVNGHDIEGNPICTITPSGAACGAGIGQDVIGDITIPRSIRVWNWTTGNGSTENNIGVFIFINRLLILFFSICVIWFMVNLVIVGVKFISSQGDPKVFESLKEAIFYPVIGMVILASAFALVALIGIFFFGDPTFITNPQLPRAIDFTQTP